MHVLQPEIQPEGVVELAKRGFFFSVKDGILSELRKGDDLGQAIALWQLFWLFITVIGRWASHLPVSLLELNTFINIIFAFAFYSFWFRYSIDIAHPIVVDDSPFQDYLALFLMASRWNKGKGSYELSRETFCFSEDDFFKQSSIHHQQRLQESIH